ncbi:hydroxyacylglutathione hydrolase, partial [Rhizobium leguminosarum]
MELDVLLGRTDNFGVLGHDPETCCTAAIDAPEEAPILEAATRRGWKITNIFTTHHHT